MTQAFLRILNMSLSASWLALAVILLRLLLRKGPKWLHVLLWGMVGLRLSIPFFFESGWSLIPSPQAVSSDLLLGWEDTAPSGPVSSVIGQGDSGPEAGVDLPSVWLAALAAVWIGGMVLMLGYTVLSWLSLARRVRTAVPLWENIYQSEAAASPFVMGLVRPRIVLPFAMAEGDRDYVVAHERAHIRRWDHWWKPLGFLLLTLHWFNPVIWLAYILLCRDIELACDQRVVRDLEAAQRADYAQALLSCSLPRLQMAAGPLAFGEVGVKGRVKAVLYYKKPTFWAAAATAAAAVLLAVCFLTDPKGDSGEPDLSFLNYNNAISLVADREAVMAIHCPPAEGEENNFSILIGEADGAALALYLDWMTWDKCAAPRDSLSSPGSVEFVIEEDYRITIYQRKDWAFFPYVVVKYGDDVRYYRADGGDYDKAVGILRPPTENPGPA